MTPHAIEGRSETCPTFWLLASVAVYGVAIVWVTANDVEFLHGRSAGAAPWYTIVLLPPLLGLSLAGGRVLASITAVLFLYILAVTYVVKLIPLYSGFPEGRTTLAKTLEWYGSGPAWRETLSVTSLAPWYVICVGVCVVLALGVLILTMVLRSGWLQWRAKTHQPHL